MPPVSGLLDKPRSITGFVPFPPDALLAFVFIAYDNQHSLFPSICINFLPTRALALALTEDSENPVLINTPSETRATATKDISSLPPTRNQIDSEIWNVKKGTTSPVDGFVTEPTHNHSDAEIWSMEKGSNLHCR